MRRCAYQSQMRTRPSTNWRCSRSVRSYWAALGSLPLLLACWPLAAGADRPVWTDVRQSGPFVCHATFPLGEYEQLLNELPELQKELTQTLGVPAATGPIHIYLFADAGEHRQFVAARFPKIPYRQALFVKLDREISVYAYRQAALGVDLRHECTHALFHSAWGDLPLWLDEGLAEYFEVAPVQRAFQHPNFDSLRWNMRLGIVRPIETLESRRELADMSGLDYSYSWAWVHFLLHGSEAGRLELVQYLADHRGATDAGRFSSRLNAKVPSASEKFVRHFKMWRPSPADVKP